MKITIESTILIVKASGIDCRVWEGETESGIKVHCLIPRIAVNSKEDCSQFERELSEQMPPSPDYEPFPLRMIL